MAYQMLPDSRGGPVSHVGNLAVRNGTRWAVRANRKDANAA